MTRQTTGNNVRSVSRKKPDAKPEPQFVFRGGSETQTLQAGHPTSWGAISSVAFDKSLLPRSF